jgi:AraC family transcriptional activator of pobA
VPVTALELARLAGRPARVAVFHFDWRAPGYGSARQVCDFVSLSVHLGGPSVMWRGGHEDVERGDVVALAAGEPHQVLDFGQARGVAVAFLPSVVDRWPRLLEAVVGPGRFRPSASDRESLVTGIERLGATCASSEPFSEVNAEAQVLGLLVQLSRLVGTPLPQGSVLSRRAVAWLQGRAHKPVSLRDVGAALDVNPRHLATVVRRDTGKSVGEWLTLFRVTKARQVLRHTDLPIDEVALSSGYGDVTHFIRSFKQVEGQTPAAFRRACHAALTPPR